VTARSNTVFVERPLGKPTGRNEDNAETYLKETGCEDVDSSGSG